MSSYETTATNTSYLLRSVIFRDVRDVELELKNVMSDFVIYEHILKPYLTAKFTFLDQENILDNNQGGETLEVTLVEIEERNTGQSIKKTFLIDEISSIHKASADKDELVVLHCTEDHALHSSLQNVNRVLSGSPTKMISDLCNEFLDRNVDVIGENINNNMKVCIPHLHPLEACMFLRPRVLTSIGMPFYFYSALGAKDLILKDLGTMISQSPINEDVPYIYAQSMESTRVIADSYQIQQFEYSGAENLLKLIRQGLVGAKYNFYDSITGQRETSRFDVNTNLFERLSNQNLFGSNKRYLYQPDYKHKSLLFHSYNSKNITEISGNQSYKNGNVQFNSYDEETDVAYHIHKIIADAASQFITKAPLSITVKAREFITGNANHTIGQTIRIRFLDSAPIEINNRPEYDIKKSGDYIIVAAQHNFSGQQATTRLLCGRLASMGENGGIIV